MAQKNIKGGKANCGCSFGGGRKSKRYSKKRAMNISTRKRTRGGNQVVPVDPNAVPTVTANGGNTWWSWPFSSSASAPSAPSASPPASASASVPPASASVQSTPPAQ